MRIVSKFHDYYDNVQMYGQDPSILYIRKTEPVNNNENSLECLDKDFYAQVANIPDVTRYKWELWHSVYKDAFYHSSFVTFIGDTYVKGIKLEKDYTDENNMSQTKSAIAFSLEEVDDFVFNSKLFTEEQADRYTGKKQYRKYRVHQDISKHFCQKDLKIFFETKMQKNLCVDLRCPVVFYGNAKCFGLTETDDFYVVKNPCLNILQLYKALPHGLAFQKIESFISGVLPGRYPEMIEVSEKTRLAKRGFDKWSFRKMPTKKKI